MELLFIAVPVWAILVVQAAGLGICALFYHRLQQRLAGHAESIANMDAWADDVDAFIARTKSLERQKVVRYAIDPRIANSSAARLPTTSQFWRERPTSH